MINDQSYAAELIARYMEKSLSDQQSNDLDRWMLDSDANMQLFEQLTEKRNTEWAKQWFEEHGVKNRSLPKKKYPGWYVPQQRIDKTKDFYWLVAAAVLFTATGLLALKFYTTPRPETEAFAFTGSTINEVAGKMEKRYQISIHYEGKSSKKFTATLPKEYLLLQTIDTLQKILDVDIQILGREKLLIKDREK